MSSSANTPSIYRTPDSAFVGLTDFPFAPHYIEWDGLRTHYLDEGPSDAPIALLLHGEPTWSYLYRTMIPPLLAAGYRCIAPDHIGFGKSDKVLEDNWYVIERHVDRLEQFVARTNLRRITVFVQDWGGPTGLISALRAPQRYERLVILNTWLHHEGYEYSAQIRRWRDAATHTAWLRWTGGDLPCGAIVLNARIRRPADPQALKRAYEAPYPEGGKAKAGARRFPWCIPFAQPVEGAAHLQAQAFEQLKHWDIPKHLIFGADDGVFTPQWGRQWAAMLPGASFDVIERAGHFVQDDAGEDIVAVLRQRIG